MMLIAGSKLTLEALTFFGGCDPRSMVVTTHVSGVPSISVNDHCLANHLPAAAPLPLSGRGSWRYEPFRVTTP